MPKPLYYTFGNHMHWVDMQWLWGYGVLPGCVDDMLRLIRETGARGNVNFDAVGYEKMAAECPEALAALREAVTRGDVEPVGCSYGQPYALFHGLESNIRQFTVGVRATRRLLGVRPRTFWEEEFYFFPQLPQVLASCGYTGACLFFQWTWHTPEIPKENTALILWEGVDGTRLPALPRNTLNVHQWPEDFDGLLEQGLVKELPAPAVVQWLELMPSKDWMCRSEVLLPRLKELMNDPRFEVRPRTTGQLVAELCRDAAEPPPVRRYAPDNVWHGMTLGKNGDAHPRASRYCEQRIMAAEAIASAAGLLGRPYPSWDVYPAWELDEAWRNTLAAQHHDNHECEGLCGFIGHEQFSAAARTAREIQGRTQTQIEARCGQPVLQNPLGFSRRIRAWDREGFKLLEVPAFGYAGASRGVPAAPVEVRHEGDAWVLSFGDLRVEIDGSRGVIRQIFSASHPEGVLAEAQPLLALAQRSAGQRWTAPIVTNIVRRADCVSISLSAKDQDPGQNESAFWIEVMLAPEIGAVDVLIRAQGDRPRPDPGFGGSLRLPLRTRARLRSVRSDAPGSVHQHSGSPAGKRKYPEGDWMTSPQWFEDVEGAIVSHRCLDLLGEDGAGLLVLHDGAQQVFRRGESVEFVLDAYDPWDEARYSGRHFGAGFRLVPHRGMRDSERARLAAAFQEETPSQPIFEGPWLGGVLFKREPVGGGRRPEDAPIPPVFGGLEVTGAPGVIATAYHRANPKDGEHLPDWAGHRMARQSDGACTHPYVVRLVEWDGEPAEVVLKLPGPVALAAKTNLMGEVGLQVGAGTDTSWLTPESAQPPDWARNTTLDGKPVSWSQVRFRMRPREIATVMVDLIMGRKQWRDLDAKREVWATAHKVDEQGR